MHEAAWNGHNESVQNLLTHRSNLEVLSKSNEKALHQAAWNGHPDIVKAQR